MSLTSDLRARGRPVFQGVGPVIRWIIDTEDRRLPCSGFWRFLLASHLPDQEWGRFCSLKHHSLCSCSARQSNLSEEGVSRPADYANLDGDEVCSEAFRFQVHRKICILFRLERIALLKSVLPRYRQLHQNDGIHRRRHEHHDRPLATFYQHLMPSASSLLCRLRRSSRFPLQECLSWTFDISFCRGLRSPRTRNKSSAD